MPRQIFRCADTHKCTDCIKGSMAKATVCIIYKIAVNKGQFQAIQQNIEESCSAVMEIIIITLRQDIEIITPVFHVVSMFISVHVVKLHLIIETSFGLLSVFTLLLKRQWIVGQKCQKLYHNVYLVVFLVY